jgi:hypothetical protein
MGMHFFAFRLAKDTKLIWAIFLIFVQPGRPHTLGDERQKEPDALPEGRESIADIMKASGTDKLTRHSYARYYERYFAEFRDMADLRILEIGADTGMSLKVPSTRPSSLSRKFRHRAAIRMRPARSC